MLWRNVSVYVLPNMGMVWCNTKRLEFLATFRWPMSFLFFYSYWLFWTFSSCNHFCGSFNLDWRLCQRKPQNWNDIFSCIIVTLVVFTLILWGYGKPVSLFIITKLLLYLSCRLLPKESCCTYITVRLKHVERIFNSNKEASEQSSKSSGTSIQILDFRS